MDNRKYDDLDKLFQSRLKEEHIVSEDWNKPPQAIFEEAMSKLSANGHKKRRRFIWWAFAGIMGAGLLFLSVYTVNRIQQLETTIAALQKEKEENAESQTASRYRNERESEQIEETAVSLTNDTEPILNQNIISPHTGHYSGERIQADLTAIPHGEPAFAGQESGSAILENISEAIEDGMREKWHIPLLPKRQLMAGSANRITVIPPNSIKGDLAMSATESRAREVHLYGFGGLNAATIKMTNTEGSDFILTGYERYYADIFAGVGLEFRLNPRWAMDLQLSYNRMHVKSTFEDEILYDKSLEINDNQGHVQYEALYDIYTVMGRESGSLSLNLAEDRMGDQEKMTNYTRIDNSFRTVGLSLGTLYTPVHRDPFRISLGLGAQYNVLWQLEEIMETQIQHKNELLFSESAFVEPADKANRNYWSVYGNIRFDYAFSKKLGIKLDIGSNHSLSSIRKISGPEDPKTYINHLNSAVMIYYNF